MVYQNYTEEETNIKNGRIVCVTSDTISNQIIQTLLLFTVNKESHDSK